MVYRHAYGVVRGVSSALGLPCDFVVGALMALMSSKKVALINPNLLLQKHDPFTTGVVYMPVSLAYFAGELRARGYGCTVIDAFGESPNTFWRDDQFLWRGIPSEEVVSRLGGDEIAIFIYAINLTYHKSLTDILTAVKNTYPNIPVVILENSQAVTAYSLRRVQGEFYDAGADYIVTGEGELRGLELLQAIEGGASTDRLKAIDGVGFRRSNIVHFTEPTRKVQELDTLAFAAWDLFPLENYWKLRYSHGPLSAKRYLPLLTSRGCPYPCRFCVIPETNDLRWRARSAQHVVDEIEHHQKSFGVSEFHIEDVDPTVKDSRTKEISQEIIRRGLKITWKVCSGTKVETLKSEETIELMAQSGCKYISISPESGSPRVMKLIKKPFDIEHAIRLIHKMNEVGIHSQACFVLGFPGEEDEDRQLTKKMIKNLVKNGLDEIAIFVVTPVPGSDIFSEFEGYSNYSELHFSPTWRQDYEKLNRFRVHLYRSFLLWKLLYNPLAILKQPFNFLLRRFETKMEMVPYRAAHTFLMLKGFAGKEIYPARTEVGETAKMVGNG
jgi:anaerobic magnesium-protoporphyrin IX monomethyl ester cyclase